MREACSLAWQAFPLRLRSLPRLLGIADRSRILAVGDSLRTDIAGAAGAGIDSVLIAGGIHADEFGTRARTPDLERVEAALRESFYNPVGVAWSFCWCEPSVAAFVQNRLAQPCVVADPERGQDRAVRHIERTRPLRSSTTQTAGLRNPLALCDATTASPM